MTASAPEPLSPPEARVRLRDAARRLDPLLNVDPASVFWYDEPFAGISCTLVLGEARALFFVPAADIDGDGWEERLLGRIEGARRYLEGFPRPSR